ncbi:MAG: response regulator [Alphaproteobacteria bacterium]|nr:response regulator [Alphaproteobacteria bacterium]
MSLEDVQSDQNLVLILENDELVGKGLALLLRDAGYQTIVFKSLSDARDSVGAEATAVSAIISDYHLDSGPNGVEAARALRATHQPEPPVLIVTGTQQRDVVAAAREAGFDVSFKPASPAFLRQWLAHKTAGRLRSQLQ